MDTCECLNGLVVAGSREVRTLMARLYKTEVDTPSPSVQTATFWRAQLETMAEMGSAVAMFVYTSTLDLSGSSLEKI